MRHRKHGRQFSRNTSHRRAMLRALTANLVLHDRVETTEAKAKELRRVAERTITKAIRLGSVAFTPFAELSPSDRARRLAAQQQVGKFLQRFGTTQSNGSSKTVDLVEKVFVDLAKRFQGRPGGYTRILKLGNRRGDNAPMSLVEFVVQAPAGGTEEKAKKKAAAKDKPGKVPEKAEPAAKVAEAAPKAEKPKAKTKADPGEKAAKAPKAKKTKKDGE